MDWDFLKICPDIISHLLYTVWKSFHFWKLQGTCTAVHCDGARPSTVLTLIKHDKMMQPNNQTHFSTHQNCWLVLRDILETLDHHGSLICFILTFFPAFLRFYQQFMFYSENHNSANTGVGTGLESCLEIPFFLQLAFCGVGWRSMAQGPDDS